MKRKIISIDAEKCTGCGQCIPDCPEGALQLIDGKARLVSDLFCDGLGACIGTCPEGAISVVEREAVPYDEKAVMKTIAGQGAPVIRAHLEHLLGHGQKELYDTAIEFLIGNTIPIPDHDNSAYPKKTGRWKSPAARTGPSSGHPAGSCPPAAGRTGEGSCHPEPLPSYPFAGCPGSAAQSILRESGGKGIPRQPPGGSAASELRQWPVQLALLNPSAPYFENADLLVSADCAPFAYPGFHGDLLRGKILIIFCPKLDADIDGYIDKLAEIFIRHTIKSVTVARMEVPCCGGVRYVAEKALEKAGKTIPVEEKTISIQGGMM
jgi:NAD-dependent dihydropyrimidine dehydrogenase PreA subunit